MYDSWLEKGMTPKKETRSMYDSWLENRSVHDYWLKSKSLQIL